MPAVRDYIAQGCLLGGALQKTQKRLGGALFQEINALLQQALVAHQRGDPSLHRAWIERMLRDYDDPMYEYQLAHRYGVAEFTGTPTEVREYLRQTAQMC